MNLTAEDGRNQDRVAPRLSFEDFVEEWYLLVDAKAHAKFRDPNLADDLAQQTWVKAARAFQRGVRPKDPQSWLLTILKREAISILRQRSPVSLLSEPASPPTPDPLEQREQAARVRRVLDEFSGLDREILVLRYIEGCPRSEMCRRLGLSKRVCNRRLADARKRFIRIFRLSDD